MDMVFVKGFDHANSSDEEEEVVSLTSKETEKYKILKIILTSVSNVGFINAYIEREKIVENLPIEGLNIQNKFEIPIDEELEIGHTFKVTLKNKVSGTNAEVKGYVLYDIIT
jgi:hypothetical protein